MFLTFEQNLTEFVGHVEALAGTLPTMIEGMQKVLKDALTTRTEFLAAHTTASVREGEGTFYVLPPERIAQYRVIDRTVSHTLVVIAEMPRSFFVSLVSQFDAFMGNLLRTVFNVQPEIINTSERVIKFGELSRFTSIEEAKEHIIEKEVESILRESHSDHFKWLEGRLDIPLRKDLHIWPSFIELTERRNLFVHAGGIVSANYLATCVAHKIKNEPPTKLGDRLEVSGPYFAAVSDTIFELSVKLAHVLWRKLLSGERERADASLNEVAFGLIANGKYKLAIAILTFATETIKTHSSQIWKLSMLLNLAQAYKWDGDQARCKTILNKIDTTASEDKFKLAKTVLSDDFTAAYPLMRSIGNCVKMKQFYHIWPIFREIRKTAEFKKIYKEIYGSPFEEGVRSPAEPGKTTI